MPGQPKRGVSSFAPDPAGRARDWDFGAVRHGGRLAGRARHDDNPAQWKCDRRH